MSKHYYPEAEREALCKEYLASKQTRKEFCAAHDISTKSLSRWLSNVSKAQEPRFVPIGELTAVTDVATEIRLPNGIDIKLRLQASEISGLIRGLVL